MRQIIVMPKVTATMTEGTIGKWLKRIGDPLKAGEPLLGIETDKATQVIEASVTGILAEILAQEGEEVRVSRAIALIDFALLPASQHRFDRPSASHSPSEPDARGITEYRRLKRTTDGLEGGEYVAHIGFEFTGREMFCELLGPLVGLKEEWQAQGATEDEISLQAFGWDNVMNVWICNDSAAMEGHSQFGARLGPMSGLTPTVVEDNAEFRIVRDVLGRRTKLCKASGTVPLPLEYPVRTADDWQRIKTWYEYREDRVNPEKLREMKQQQDQGCLTIVGMPGGFDEPRQLMGEAELCIAFYEQPELIRDMLTTSADTAVRVLERVVEVLPVDCLFVHEDLAGKSGPLVGPKQVREFIFPYYRRIWDFLKDHGTRIFSQDSDGMIEPVIDDFLVCGINAFFPFEPGAGMDMVRTRKKYGRKFAIKGGIDKYVLRGTKQDIRRELEYKMCDAMRGGGTIFCLDHRIPNGVPLENYRYYVRTGREILGLPLEQKGDFVWMGF